MGREGGKRGRGRGGGKREELVCLLCACSPSQPGYLWAKYSLFTYTTVHVNVYTTLHVYTCTVHVHCGGTGEGREGGTGEGRNEQER